MIQIICVGKIKEKAMISLIEEYQKRLKVYTKIKFIEVAELAAPAKNSDAQNQQVIDEEGEACLAKIKDQDYVILLDLHGQSMTSEKFAAKLQEVNTYQSSTISFVIGGSLGVSDALRKRAQLLWKLSDCTFPHQLVRLLVIEQVYRSYKIKHNEPYHK